MYDSCRSTHENADHIKLVVIHFMSEYRSLPYSNSYILQAIPYYPGVSLLLQQLLVVVFLFG